MLVVFIALSVIFFFMWRAKNAKLKESEKLRQSEEDASAKLTYLLSDSEGKNKLLQETVDRLSKYSEIDDLSAEIERLRSVAAIDLETAKQEREQTISAALKEYNGILEKAELRAKEIAGDAYEIAVKAKEYKKIAEAMKNTIDGYGSEYLKPTYSLLDELASDFGYTEAGQQLKAARDNSARLVKEQAAASCEYVEVNRKTTAIAFVVDAFNGKVDSILSKTKKDNFGTLEQKIKDAFQLVNYNGQAFKNAAITQEYLSARMEELKWGVIVSELKAKAQEEQRQLRERLREEEKARREYEKAIKDAAKEEDMLRKAMEKAQQQIATATEAKRAEFEAKLQELQDKLREAEARGQRAISMAQQTRHGNVYIISNIGSFGENIYKVGMTRRLDPLDRVKELGDASVPFQFDVHAIIESEDAPALEKELHNALSLMQMNKVNPRKEFFKVPISDIKALVDGKGYAANWTMVAEASEYRETLAIEDAMKNDPEAMRKWEAYAASIEAVDNSDEEG